MMTAFDMLTAIQTSASKPPATATHNATTSPWFPIMPAEAPTRLFCFGYAGGGASIFKTWPGAFGADVDVVAVQPPGREDRALQPPYRRLEALIDDLQRAIRPHLDRPFAFYGHSMGALVSFELTRQLQRDGDPLPYHLFPAAFRAPHLPNPNFHISHLPDEVLKAVLAREGTPAELLRDTAFMSKVLPTLRADFEVCETYEHQSQDPLPMPISALGGANDVRVKPALMKGWAEHTHAEFDLTILPGSHFFLHGARTHIIEVLDRRLRVRSVQGTPTC